jgi:predicted GNAT family acetyltransferase
MTIEHKNSNPKGIFFVRIDGETVGEMTYVWTNDRNFLIDHTGVIPEQEGKGIARKLVKSAVDFARENSYTITPQCPFARAEFQRHADYNDVKKR